LSETESRDTREEVMRRLEVETTVEEIEVGRARDVHCGPKLTVRVRFEEFGRG